MKLDLETEIRMYIIIFGMSFLLVLLCGCKATTTHANLNYGTNSGMDWVITETLRIPF